MDTVDRKILSIIQRNADISLSDLALAVNLSKNPCWRRLSRLRSSGMIRKNVALLDPKQLNVAVTVFVNIKTKEHSEKWFKQFLLLVSAIPEVVDFYRMSGNVDYLLKVVVPSIEGFDRVYKQLIAEIDFAEVSSNFAMENLKNTTELPLSYIDG